MIFRDRREAGQKLAERLASYQGRDIIVLGIPRGGVPIGYEISHSLSCPLEVVVPRKLPVPWSPEAGFGAVMPDGTRVLNEGMVANLGLSERDIDRIAESVLREVKRRETLYRGNRPPPELAGKVVILTDDGLATGYTMLAAVKAVRKQEPASIVVAVPVSPRDTAREVAHEADEMVVLYISDQYPFAVAMFYQDFADMSDEEVIGYLR